MNCRWYSRRGQYRHKDFLPSLGRGAGLSPSQWFPARTVIVSGCSLISWAAVTANNLVQNNSSINLFVIGHLRCLCLCSYYKWGGMWHDSWLSCISQWMVVPLPNQWPMGTSRAQRRIATVLGDGETDCCGSFAKLCLTLCDPMDFSTPGFPVLHYLLAFAQTHVHWVGSAVQLSHALSSPSPPALNLSSIRVFSTELALHIRWPK